MTTLGINVGHQLMASVGQVGDIPPSPTSALARFKQLYRDKILAINGVKL